MSKRTDTIKGLIEFATDEEIHAIANIKGDVTLPNHPTYGLDEWMIGWNTNAHYVHDPEWQAKIKRLGARDATKPGDVLVGPWPDTRGWSDAYESTNGCCFSHWHQHTRAQKLQSLVNGFFQLVLHERLDPLAVHREFWKIADYRLMRMDALGGGSYVMFAPSGYCNPCNPI